MANSQNISQLDSSISIFGPCLADSLFVKLFNELRINQRLSFNQLKRRLNANSNTLRRSLKKFTKSGLINHIEKEKQKGNRHSTESYFPEKKQKDRKHSFYEMSEFGMKLFLILADIQNQFVPEGKIRMTAYDIFDRVEKTLLLDEEEICWSGNRKNSIEGLVSGVPHRNNEDCTRFCRFAKC